MTLETIDEFVVPFSLVDQTLKPLRDAGRRGYEAFVLWGGQPIDDRRFQFTAAYVPAQTTSRGEDGLLVVVDGEALFRVNRDFYAQGLILGGQVHSHPTDAYHSATDDTYPLITLAGGLSGVVPNFGRGGRRGVDQWAWYRLQGPARWAPVGDETTITFR